ncbi:hypothetical protein V9R51_003317 [Vibrio cholerae]|uniref:Uncharacterized protein n=1 Tax=Vibrio fluvialis TaxID=676 RepID=A0AAX2LVV4_VIBFL|nr:MULTISPECIES: hypothetical protein [Vibrio]EJE4213928.1 hypothetical protein [Vibrio cholerae]MBY8229014.1 hypothetical protein [Vibrio fluvialis]MCE7634330.1 hypothetical protein [Vibrio fluvialis]MCR9379379.1 hypothetical protein [Vibrio cholerae]SUP30761.1 Uncharacterised protein [Vibrio fluvialis]
MVSSNFEFSRGVNDSDDLFNKQLELVGQAYDEAEATNKRTSKVKR